MVIVPMKPFAEAKQRLAAVMDETARVELARELFKRTLRVVRRARGITRVLVVSRDRQVLKIAREFGAWAIWEAQAGLNEALEQATQVAQANGVDAVLIVPADLPNLETRDVEEISARGQSAPCVVIAPAARDEGTNALLVNPAGLIRYAFGEQSFVVHQQRARKAGARVEIYRSESIACDVDCPEDLERIGHRFSQINTDKEFV
jgi:2-phospho-L-lactate guanylyltransferase